MNKRGRNEEEETEAAEEKAEEEAEEEEDDDDEKAADDSRRWIFQAFYQPKINRISNLVELELEAQNLTERVLVVRVIAKQTDEEIDALGQALECLQNDVQNAIRIQIEVANQRLDRLDWGEGKGKKNRLDQ